MLSYNDKDGLQYVLVKLKEVFDQYADINVPFSDGKLDVLARDQTTITFGLKNKVPAKQGDKITLNFHPINDDSESSRLRIFNYTIKCFKLNGEEVNETIVVNYPPQVIVTENSIVLDSSFGMSYFTLVARVAGIGVDTKNIVASIKVNDEEKFNINTDIWKRNESNISRSDYDSLEDSKNSDDIDYYVLEEDGTCTHMRNGKICGTSLLSVNDIKPNSTGNVSITSNDIQHSFILHGITYESQLGQVVNENKANIEELDLNRLSLEIDEDEVLLKGGNAGGDYHVYVSNENIVGKWKDGRDIYEAIISGTATNGGSNDWVDTGVVINNFREKISERGTIVINGSQHDIASLQIKMTNEKLYVWQRVNTGRTTYNYTIILNYTKND